MAVRSKQLWSEAIASGQLSAAIEWQDSGSILLARNATEGAQLEERAAALEAAGLPAEILNKSELLRQEPGLTSCGDMKGLLLQSDAQVNGRLAAETWLGECLASGSRFTFLQGEGASKIDADSSGAAHAVQTDSGRRFVARQAVVVACGAWTGQLLADSLDLSPWRQAFQPRKGHLLEVEPPPGMPRVSHGLMELGYASHYKAQAARGSETAAITNGDDTAITFTATTSASGSLLLGSSREFAGFDKQRVTAVERAIIQRAAEFLPHLSGLNPAVSKTRVGLRPFSPTGPIIGQVPGFPGLLVAGGHEGSGLTLAPATAEIIAASLFGGDLPSFAAGLAPQRQHSLNPKP